MSGSSSGRIGRIVSSCPSGQVQVLTYFRGYGRIARRGRSFGSVAGSWRTTRASSAMSRSGEASSGLMSSSAIQALLGDELAEADQQLLELGEVDAPAAADALERRVDLRALHHPAGERRVERAEGRARGP